MMEMGVNNADKLGANVSYKTGDDLVVEHERLRAEVKEWKELAYGIIECELKLRVELGGWSN